MWNVQKTLIYYLSDFIYQIGLSVQTSETARYDKTQKKKWKKEEEHAEFQKKRPWLPFKIIIFVLFCPLFHSLLSFF